MLSWTYILIKEQKNIRSSFTIEYGNWTNSYSIFAEIRMNLTREMAEHWTAHFLEAARVAMID